MYINYSEVTLRYPMLNTWANSCFMIVSDTIIYAEQCVNSLLAPCFSVPFDGAHPTVKDLSIDLTYYALLNIKSPDKAVKLKDNIIGRINRIKSGKEYIITDSYTIIKPSITAGAWSSIMDYHPVFCMLDAVDSIIDSDRLLDKEIERGKYKHGTELIMIAMAVLMNYVAI